MKFCPNCGAVLNDKKKCECGYDVETGEVDEKVYEDFKNAMKANYEQSCDVLPNFGFGTNGFNMDQPIFNKEPDMIDGADYIEQMEEFREAIEKIKQEEAEEEKEIEKMKQNDEYVEVCSGIMPPSKIKEK